MTHTARPVRLTGRVTSHFTRVARMVAIELAVPVELEPVDDLLSLDPVAYGGHPALKIPTLHVDDSPLFGTDHICRRLAELAGRVDDPRVVLSERLRTAHARNAQELIWHAMAAQVQLVIGVGASRLPADGPFFAKVSAGLHGALAWLDRELAAVQAALPAARQFSVLEVSLYCLVEHLSFRPMIAIDAYPALRAFAAAYGERPAAVRTPFRSAAR